MALLSSPAPAGPLWYHFGPFRLDARRELLFKGDELVPLTPKVVQTLLALVSRAGEIVPREDLLHRIWSDTLVLDSNLTQNIWILRRTLEPEVGAAIQTFARRGYKFHLPVRSVQEEPSSGPALPRPPSALVGRHRELEELCTLLQHPEPPLITIVGPGGTGKTRLALEVAARIEARFPHGVRFVDLSTCLDEVGMAAQLARVLGVEEEPGQPMEPLLHRALAHRRPLILLDNLEQIEGAGAFVARLLAAAPGLRLLATSRVRLHLRSERVFTLPPLALPDPEADPDRIAASESVQFFVAQARAQQAALTWDGPTARAVAEICRRLDGLPLALELAAARTRMLSAADLLRQLEDGIGRLEEGPWDMPERHRTLRNALAWSTRLLTPAQRHLFHRLGLFEGAFSLEAASAVAEAPALDALQALCDLHLVVPGRGAATHFSLLQTVREFALETLPADAAKAALDRFARSAVNFAERRAQALFSESRAQALAELAVDHGNLKMALDHLEAAQPTEALRLAAALAPFWHLEGHWEASLTRLGRTLAAAPGADPGVRARALLHLGRLHFFLGDESAALDALRRARAAEPTDPVTRVMVLDALAQVHLKTGADAEGEALLAEALPLARDAGHTFSLAEVLATRGTLMAATGDLDGAEAHLQEALDLARRLHAAPILIRVLYYLAGLALLRSDAGLAVRRSEEALLAIPEAADASWSYHLLEMYGRSLVAAGRTEEAAPFLRDSLEAIAALASHTCIPHAMEALARLEQARRAPAPAARFLGAAEGVCGHLGIAMLPLERSLYRQSCAALPPGLQNGPEWREGRGWAPEEALSRGRVACREA